MKLTSLFILLSFLLVSDGSKILFILPLPAHSHFTLGQILAKELAHKGHEVTVISPYPQKNPVKNYQDISIASIIEFAEQEKEKLMNSTDATFWENIQTMIDLFVGVSERTLAHENVQTLLKSNKKFDVIILDHFLNEALIGLGYRFKAPVILLFSQSASSLNNKFFANPSPISYIPNTGSSLTKNMNFWERIQNFVQITIFDIVVELLIMPYQRNLFKKYIPSDIELDDNIYNVSLMLTNSHVSVSDAIPHVPSIIEIGGFHIESSKKLPQELQKFLDESKNGVVLFALGSNVKSSDLKPDVRAAILSAFNRIKENVLWKFESDLPEAPPNVKIVRWLPQQEVLAHPNVRAFITHGGVLSLIETIYYGVPIIGIPVFGDQLCNVAGAVNNGYAVRINLEELSRDKISWALDEILNNTKYRKEARKRSQIMRDQPLNPLDSAVYWVEHVIRHKGARHLRSAGLDLRWYQREMIDIAFFFTVLLVSILFIVVVLTRQLFRCLFKSKIKVPRTKKTN